MWRLRSSLWKIGTDNAEVAVLGVTKEEQRREGFVW